MTIMIMIITRERVLSWVQANKHCSAHTLGTPQPPPCLSEHLKGGSGGRVLSSARNYFLTHRWSRDHYSLLECVRHCRSQRPLYSGPTCTRDFKGNTQPSKGNGFPSFPNRRAALPSPPESLPTVEGGRRGSHDQGDDDGEDCDDGVKEDDAGVFGGESKSTRLPRTSTWGSSHSSKVWPPTPPHWRTQYVNSSLCSDMVVGWTMSTASSPSQL